MSSVTDAWRYVRLGPSHLAMYVLGRFTSVRSMALRRYRAREADIPRGPTKPVPSAPVIEPIDIDEAASAVLKDGYFPGLRLLPSTLETLRRFSAMSICLADGDARFPFAVGQRIQAEQSYGRRIRIGRFDHLMQDCPEVYDVASDPTIVSIARKYLGCEPVFLGGRVWWSFPTNADLSEQMSMGQGFHFDLDGYASIAFFFHLTDVGPADGPHVVVRKSHLKKPLRGLISLHKGRRDAEIEDWYGKESQVTLCGPSGFGFAEDLFCYHRGMHPKQGERLILQLRFGIRQYYDPWTESV